ncbi:MAG: GNAT family protein [bacterium]
MSWRISKWVHRLLSRHALCASWLYDGGLQLMLQYAFKKLKLHRVEANIQPANAASIALVKRAGFSREGFSRRYLKVCGRWRDHERWAIVVEDWKSKSIQ